MMTVLMMLITVSAMSAEQKIWLRYSSGGKAKISLDGKGLELDKENKATVKDAAGLKVAVTATPDEGYTVSSVTAQLSVTLDGGNSKTRGADDASFLEVTKASDTEYIFTMPEAGYNVVINVTFESSRKGGWDRTTSTIGDDYSGTYYIASYAKVPDKNQYYYDPTNPTSADNFYLCPSDGWIYYKKDNDWTADKASSDGPFLTTFKCRTSAYNDYGGMSNAKWVVTKHGDYYTFYHTGTSKYLVLSSQITGCGADRMRVHLEEISSPDNPDDNALFTIAPQNQGLYIAPKTIPSDRLTVNGGNKNALSGQSGKTGGPVNKPEYDYENTAGIVGIYRGSGTDDNRYFYLEDIITRPTISYSSGNEVTITYPTSATIYYTTDGSDPTDDTNQNRSYFTGTSQTVAFTNVAVVKAAAKVGEEYSNVATYVYVHTGSSNPYLLQSVENTNFYMLAGDARNETTTTVNTSSLPQAGMSWHFEDAGIVNGVQCYYIYNTSATGYLRRDNNNFYIQSTKENDNDYKFAIIPYTNEDGTLAGFNLKNIGKSQHIYKASANNIVGNGSNGAVNLSTDGSQTVARWNLILVDNKSFPSPVTVSDNTSATYYTFTSSDATSYLITPPSGTATYVKTSNVVSDNQKWYFKAAGDDGWATYYYILNALTGEAMFFGKEAASTTISDALKVGALPETPTDNYKFTLAKTTEDGKYYIIPKPLAQFTKTNYSGIWYVNTSSSLQTQSNRASNKIKWQINEVENYVAPPYITYVLSTNTMTMSCTTPGATIYYTTDGETASTSSSNTIAHENLPKNFVLQAGENAIRAIAYKESVGTSQQSEYDVLVQLTLSDADANLRPYLIQSQNNGWNTTDFHFYMIPGDEDNSIIKVNTTSLFRPTMEWYFKDGGVESDTQYYFIVNKNGKNLCYDTTNGVYLDTNSDNANKFKFSIARNPATGTLKGYNLIPYGLTTGDMFVHKGNNNDNAAVVTLNNNGGGANSLWKFVTKDKLNTTAPFNVIDENSTSYYKIGSAGSSGYYIVPPSGTATNATTSNSSDAEVVKSMNWYFEQVAGTPTDDDWLPYYYIRNVMTNECLYFSKDDNTSEACLEMRSTIEGDADRYMFTWARTATADTYYIIPKKLKDKQLNQISSLQRNGNTLQSGLTRGAGNFAWTFNPSTICLNPKFEYVGETLSMTCATKPSEIYYTIDGTDPDSSKSKYSSGLPYADNAQIYIKAIAVLENDHDVKSDIITFVKNPDVTFEEGYDFSYTGLAKEPPVTSVTVTPDGTTTPVVINDSEYDITYGDDNGDPYINAGDATVTISDAVATNNFIISGKAPFTITPKSLGDGTTAAAGIVITVTKVEGTPISYTVTVKNGTSITLVENTDYTLNDVTSDDSGYRATITAVENSNYSGGAKIIFVKADFPTANSNSGGAVSAYQASIDLATPPGLTAYIVTGINLGTSTVEVKKVDYIPNGKPILLLTDEGAPHDADFTTSLVEGVTDEQRNTDTEGNLLKKSVGGESVDWGQYYIFSKGEFVLSMGGKTMNVGKFYFENNKYVSDSTTAPTRLSFARGATSEISDVVNQKENDPRCSVWYSIDGQKLNQKPTRKGIYIHNGHKIIIK